MLINQEELEKQRKEAERLITEATRTQLGGGLADPNAVDAVSKLFSGGISVKEIEEFGGVQNVLARQAEIDALAARNVSVNPSINVTVGSISSSYDVRLLAEDLGFYLGGSISSALGGV